MRIAILCYGTSGKGGMETVISHIIGALNELGHDTELFLLGGSYDQSWLGGVRSRVVGKSQDSKLTGYVKYAFLLPGILWRFSPDVIVGADDRAVWTAMMMKRMLGLKAPVASWMHFAITDISYGLLKNADFHLAINSENVQQLIDLHVAKPDKIYLVHNPVKLTDRTVPRPTDVAHFIYMGRLTYGGQKRVSDFITALSQVKGAWQATIMGDGIMGDRVDKERLQELAKTMGIHTRIQWIGWQRNPWAEIHSASALVLTSEYEGFGMVLVEAMSHGIACVSSDCRTGPVDIVKEGINGWFYPVRDVAKLATILQRITDAPDALPQAQDIRSTIEHFGSEHVIPKLIRAFQKETATPGSKLQPRQRPRQA
jgi:UDP-D-galactose:(glucosyl)LPS alpha-1,6-D-galactosyltransferase